MRGNSIVRFIGELRRNSGLACDRGPTFTTDCIRPILLKNSSVGISKSMWRVVDPLLV